MNELNNDPDFEREINFSDETQFQLGGYVNTIYSRICGTENAHAVVQNSMHPARATVWCGFWSGGVTGIFFFKLAAGRTLTVNGERYRDMITNFMWQELHDIDLDAMVSTAV